MFPCLLHVLGLCAGLSYRTVFNGRRVITMSCAFCVFVATTTSTTNTTTTTTITAVTITTSDLRHHHHLATTTTTTAVTTTATTLLPPPPPPPQSFPALRNNFSYLSTSCHRNSDTGFQILDHENHLCSLLCWEEVGNLNHNLVIDGN